MSNPISTMKQIIKPILVICLSGSTFLQGFSHDLGIIRIHLQELDTGYVMTAQTTPDLASVLSPPLLPHCTYLQENRNVLKGVLRFNFSCQNQVLSNEDTIIFNWPVNGIVFTVKWKNNTTATRFFPAKESGIIVQMEQLRAASPSLRDAIRRYTVLGIEHILMGIDHLFFIFGLLLIVKTNMQLVKTITAFTIAHSITLAFAALGYIHPPEQLINALVALSIIFIGTEVIHTQRGKNNLTQHNPWIIAFVFGLLHGFGFAGALNTLGLPGQEIPLALITFNVGVEIGQLIFVAVFIVMTWSFRQLKVCWPKWAIPAPGYLIGSLAAFWFIERLTYIF